MKALLFLLALAALPHKSAWNEDQLRWVATDTCTTGESVAQCPVEGYQLDTAADNSSTVWTTIAKVGPTTYYYDVTNLAPGKHCYALRIIYGGGKLTAPSLMGCDITVAPVLVPALPSLVMVDGT